MKDHTAQRTLIYRSLRHPSTPPPRTIIPPTSSGSSITPRHHHAPVFRLKDNRYLAVSGGRGVLVQSGED